jgi:uncharacterized OB-fold protein
MDQPRLPAPAITPETAPFWEGLEQGELRLQRCQSCGRFRHHPRPMCPACHSLEREWVPVSGRGTVYSYTRVEHQAHPALGDRMPYTILLIELAEGIRIVSSPAGIPDVELRIGLPVRAIFERPAPDQPPLQFVRDDG